MTPVIYSDLDDTIFTTLKNYKDVEPASLRQVTTAKNGNHSFMCAARLSILNWLAAGASFVPVTARSLDAFIRVSIDAPYSGAVLNNGALILDADMNEDRDWSDRVAGACKAASKGLHLVMEELGKRAPDIRIHTHFHGDMIRGKTLLGMTVKSNIETEDGVRMVLDGVERLLTMQWASDALATMQIHRNGNNMAFVPNGVSKRNAVEYLMATRADLAGRPSIGAGDSLSDLPFMELCDMMLVPARTQASAKLFS